MNDAKQSVDENIVVEQDVQVDELNFQVLSWSLRRRLERLDCARPVYERETGEGHGGEVFGYDFPQEQGGDVRHALGRPGLLGGDGLVLMKEAE